jgi:conjugal transfer/entry exclusion protein
MDRVTVKLPGSNSTDCTDPDNTNTNNTNATSDSTSTSSNYNNTTNTLSDNTKSDDRVSSKPETEMDAWMLCVPKALQSMNINLIAFEEVVLNTPLRA